MSYFRIEKLDAPTRKPQKVLMATDAPNGYWRIAYEFDQMSSWEILIAVNQLEIEPDVLVTPEGYCFIGVEQAVFCVSEQTGEVISSIEDLSFVQSIEMLSKDRVIITAEDEALLFSTNGIYKWRVNLPDIIEDIKEIADRLEIELVSEEKLYLDTETGLPSAR